MDLPKSISLSAENENLSFKNLSRLVTSPDLLSHLQDLKLDGEEIFFSFQWHGPHLLTFLGYAIELVGWLDPTDDRPFNMHDLRYLRDLLKHLDDSASDCILYGEIFDNEHYESFLEIIPSFLPELNKFFTIQTRMFNNVDYPEIDIYWEIFLGFLFETIGELLKCRTDSSIVVSNQVNFLAKELNFLLAFLVDPISLPYEENQYKNIYTEIEAVFHEVGLFLHSFFFTTDLVTVTRMDHAIFALLEKIEIVQVKIKYHSISGSIGVGIGSLQVAESPSEVSSSQDKSIPTVEEIIVGFEDTTTQIASKLVGGPNYCQIVSIIGMGGLGKTTLAKKVYNNDNVQHYFHKLSWCVVSQTYSKSKLLTDILSSVSDLDREEMSKMKYHKLAEHLYKSLKGRRYLIVMDDLWDKETWDDLKRLFPEDRNGSRILLTSRMKNLALEISHVIIEPPPLSPDESWNLLEQNVFKKEHCPEELQEIGQQIARNCQGLPLSIIIIAGLLSNMEKKVSLWQQVAKSLSSYILQKADNYIPTLELSYKHLPSPLKPCFLYLSAFQEDEEISVRKLLLLWIAEGFIEKKEHKSLEDVAEEILMELVNRSLLQVSKRRSDNGVKTCTLHDLVLDMCRKLVVEDENFLYQHQFLASMYLRRSHHVLISMNLSKAFSIVYSLEKIRILDSRWNTNVPLGIKIMPDLRYLETQLLVPSISRLHNLEFLRWQKVGDIPAYLLNMPKLRHLHVCRGTRFSKNCNNSRGNKLQTLCYVIIDDPKDEEILRCSPNLRTLKCQVHNFCPDLNFLSQLESLTMVYESRSKVDYSVVNFPKNIRKLTLSTIGFPWEKMSLIGTLPYLEILKLKHKAFEGEIWNTKDDEFQKLKFLKLGGLDLEQWNSSYDHFPILERLVLQSCHNLEMIPLDFSNIPTLQNIYIFHCRKNMGSSALKIREEQRDNGNEEFEVTIIYRESRDYTRMIL